MVGANGFEPSTSWSRTRFCILLKSTGFCSFQSIENERLARARGTQLKFVEPMCIRSYKIIYNRRNSSVSGAEFCRTLNSQRASENGVPLTRSRGATGRNSRRGLPVLHPIGSWGLSPPQSTRHENFESTLVFEDVASCPSNECGFFVSIG